MKVDFCEKPKPISLSLGSMESDWEFVLVLGLGSAWEFSNAYWRRYLFFPPKKISVCLIVNLKRFKNCTKRTRFGLILAYYHNAESRLTYFGNSMPHRFATTSVDD